MKLYAVVKLSNYCFGNILQDNPLIRIHIAFVFSISIFFVKDTMRYVQYSYRSINPLIITDILRVVEIMLIYS